MSFIVPCWPCSARRALVCFDKVSVTLTSARKLKLRLEQLCSAVERQQSFLFNIYYFYILFSFMIYSSLIEGRFELLRVLCVCVCVCVCFFSRPYPCLCHVSYCPKVRVGFIFLFLLLLFFLTRSFIVLFGIPHYPEFTSKECRFKKMFVEGRWNKNWWHCAINKNNVLVISGLIYDNSLLTSWSTWVNITLVYVFFELNLSLWLLFQMQVKYKLLAISKRLGNLRKIWNKNKEWNVFPSLKSQY